MTPDDERSRTPAGEPAQDATSTADTEDKPDGDDLESLAGALPAESAAEATHAEADEDLNLGALAAVGGQRASGQLAEGDGRLSLGETSKANATGETELAARSPDSVRPPAPAPATPSGAQRPAQGAASASAPQPRARAPWVVPLLVGLGVGAGAAAVVFSTVSGTPQPAGATQHGVAAAPGNPTAAAVPPASAAAAPPAGLVNPPAPAPAAPPTEEPLRPASAAAPLAGAASSATRNQGVAEAARKPAGSQGPDQPSAPSATAAADPKAASFVLPGDPLADDETDTADKAAAPEDASAKSTNSMDALLDEALSPTARRDELIRRQQLALAAEQLPLTPSREDVTQAMTVLLPAIRGCAQGQSGLATAGIVVRGDGRVADVEITGAPFSGTPSGRCMEGVIRRARFTRFQQPILRIKFPLAIQ